MIRNDCDQIKLIWKCMIKSQDNNVFKLKGKWIRGEILGVRIF